MLRYGETVHVTGTRDQADYVQTEQVNYLGGRCKGSPYSKAVFEGIAARKRVPGALIRNSQYRLIKSNTQSNMLGTENERLNVIAENATYTASVTTPPSTSCVPQLLAFASSSCSKSTTPITPAQWKAGAITLRTLIILADSI